MLDFIKRLFKKCVGTADPEPVVLGLGLPEFPPTIHFGPGSATPVRPIFIADRRRKAAANLVTIVPATAAAIVPRAATGSEAGFGDD